MEAAKNPYRFAFYKRPPFREKFFFSYGTLMDPDTLAAVLGSPKKPDFYKYYIIGYHTMLWREYPALLDGPGHPVYGMACKTKTQEEMDRLAAYESVNYAVDGYILHFENGSSAFGNTLCWQGDVSILREGADILHAKEYWNVSPP